MGFNLPVLLTETGTLYNVTFGWYDLVSGKAYLANMFNEAGSHLTVMESIPSSALSPDAMAGESIR